MFRKGWKSWVGGGGLMVLGGFLALTGNEEVGLGSVATGLGIIGLGHKAEKIKALLKELLEKKTS